MIDFGREICGDAAATESREWLVTNGIGGYASGTLSGMLTRRYHGLLIAALKPPLGRTLLLTKLDETVQYDGTDYALSTNQWGNALVDPTGYIYLERFHREGTVPVWTYACADALLEKRIWMKQGSNTTYIRYTLIRGSGSVSLALKVLVNYRDYHGATQASDQHMEIMSVSHGQRIVASEAATPFYVLTDRGDLQSAYEWYQDYHLNVEIERGFEGREDHLYAGTIYANLAPGESITVVASTESRASLDGAAEYQAQRAYEEGLLTLSPILRTTEAIQDLILAADQFVVSRPTAADPEGKTVIAGYPWFGDWGRDTMISLPGLTLATGRPEVARQILLTFGQFIDQGMLPNRFPDAGEMPEYNTVDATLWYFEAIRAYVAATDDQALLRELFPVLAEIVRWHQRGTRYQIHVDPQDGLLYSGEPGVQLTWMDAKVDDWVVTPRTGKAVEINALWYNALCFMADAAGKLGEAASDYIQQAQRVRASFQRFWNESGGYCYDVIDSPTGDDSALRPNQLAAVSLEHSPLSENQQKAVIDVCARHLLTTHGLRSLAPGDPAYIGHYGGTPVQRDGAYHQGTVWSWLIGPFAAAHWRVYHDQAQVRQLLTALMTSLPGGCVGSLSEIFDGDPPFYPRGCFAQAWSVAEVLRIWHLLEKAYG